MLSSRPAKKQKLDGTPPIIFKSPGLNCNTRLLVFNQEFQVHSIILKLHSAFFRKFMDSAEKQPTVVDGFQYNWITEVDEDGSGWNLISSVDYMPLDMEKFTGEKQDAQDRFNELLRAFYVLPYTVSDLDQLAALTEMADYYCCLRILSNTVNNAILANQSKTDWYMDMEANLDQALDLAVKLRNKALFSDAVLLSVSQWDINFVVANPNIRKTIRNAYNGIALLVTKVYQGLDLERETMTADRLVRHARLSRSTDGTLRLPLYFRLINDDQRTGGRLQRSLNKILKCNLTFGSEACVAGFGFNEKSFFCAEVPDDELPWDIEETDW